MGGNDRGGAGDLDDRLHRLADRQTQQRLDRRRCAASRLWRDDVNAAGGIKAGGKHYKVNFVTYDDELQNTRVQQLYTRLIAQDKAQFLFSPYSSGLVATAAIISEQYGKVMITTGGAEEKTYQARQQEPVPALLPGAANISPARCRR